MIIAHAVAPKINGLILGIVPQIGYNQAQNGSLTPSLNPR